MNHKSAAQAEAWLFKVDLKVNPDNVYLSVQYLNLTVKNLYVYLSAGSVEGIM